MHPIDKKLIDELERLDRALERKTANHSDKPDWYKRLYTERKLKKLREKIDDAYRDHSTETHEILLQLLADDLESSHPRAANMVRRL